jgi:hypothetical protein
MQKGQPLMISATAVAGLVLSLFSAPSGAVVANDPPPAGSVTIEALGVNGGSGCSRESVALAISPDKRAFTVTYSEFAAFIAVAPDPSEPKKKCKITLRINVPAGYTYGVTQADYRGFAKLEADVTATHSAAYKFQAAGGKTESKTTNFSGSLDDLYQVTHHPAEPMWARCTKEKLDITTELTIKKGTKPITDVNVIAMDSTDGEVEGKVKSAFGLSWKRC